MKLLLDRPGLGRLLFRTESREHGDVRRYYTATAPARAIVVFRNGLDPVALAGAVVDATAGYEIGYAGFTRAGNEGQQHTKLTIYRRISAPHENTLSQMLADGWQDEIG